MLKCSIPAVALALILPARKQVLLPCLFVCWSQVDLIKGQAGTMQKPFCIEPTACPANAVDLNGSRPTSGVGVAKSPPFGVALERAKHTSRPRHFVRHAVTQIGDAVAACHFQIKQRKLDRPVFRLPHELLLYTNNTLRLVVAQAHQL